MTAGVGKSTFVERITEGRVSQANRQRTVGCHVSVKTLQHPALSSADRRAAFMVELWEVGGLPQYQKIRNVFYSQINEHGTFDAPSAVQNPSSPSKISLPVPILFVGNKSDLAVRNASVAFSYSLQHSPHPMRRAWQHLWGRLSRVLAFSGGAEAEPMLPTSRKSTWPDGISISALQGTGDFTAVDRFFLQLIERRYFMPSAPVVANGHYRSHSWGAPSTPDSSRSESLYTPSGLGAGMSVTDSFTSSPALSIDETASSRPTPDNSRFWQQHTPDSEPSTSGLHGYLHEHSRGRSHSYPLHVTSNMLDTLHNLGEPADTAVIGHVDTGGGDYSIANAWPQSNLAPSRTPHVPIGKTL
eukprot:jgi/Chlat1/5817/Chrsp4S06172